MARLFITEPVERVHAWIHVNRFGPDALYDGPALISWKYAGVPKFGSWEVIASLGMRVRSNTTPSDDRMEIHGSEGIIWVKRCTGSLLDEPALVLYRDGETRAWHDLPTDWAESFRAGAHDFIDALLDGRQPAQDAADAAATLRFAIAAHVAACEHREVRSRRSGPPRAPRSRRRDGRPGVRSASHGSESLDDRRDSHADADAHRRQAVALVACAPARRSACRSASRRWRRADGRGRWRRR